MSPGLSQLAAPAEAASAAASPPASVIIFAALSVLLRGAVVLMLAGMLERGETADIALLAFVFFNTLLLDVYAQNRLLAALLTDGSGPSAAAAGGVWSRPMRALALPAINAALLTLAMLLYAASVSVIGTLLALLIGLIGHAVLAIFRATTVRLYRQAALAPAAASARLRRAADLRLAREHGLLGAVGFAAIGVIVFAGPLFSADGDNITLRAALAGLVLVGPVTTLAGLVAPLTLLRATRATPRLPGLPASLIDWQLPGGGFTLRRGELVVISGATGIGKTNLLCRLAGLTPEAPGRVAIDQVTVPVPVAALPRLVVVVTQDRPDRAAALRAALAGDRPFILLDGALAGLDEAARDDLLAQCRAALDRKGIVLTCVPRDRPVMADRHLVLTGDGLAEDIAR